MPTMVQPGMEHFCQLYGLLLTTGATVCQGQIVGISDKVFHCLIPGQPTLQSFPDLPTIHRKLGIGFAPSLES